VPSRLLSTITIQPLDQEPVVAQLVPLLDLQIVVMALRLMASLRARLMSAMKSLVTVVSRLRWTRLPKPDTASVPRMPATASVVISSSKLNPRCPFMYSVSSFPMQRIGTTPKAA
jgi:hypothetical protein